MSEHEDPLQDLAELEREQLEERPPEWAEVAAGTLTADEAAVRTRERGAQSDDEIARARELFAPLSDDFEAGLARRLGSLGDRPGADGPTEPAPANVRRLRVGPVVAAAVAIAAAAVLWFAVLSPSSQTSPGHADSPLVPRHEIWIEAASEVRSDAKKPPTVPAGSTMTFYLRPQRSYQAEPVVWACAERAGTRHALVVQHQRHGDVLEAAAKIPAELQPGAWELVAFVSHRAAPADACNAVASQTTASERAPFVVSP